MSNIKDLSVEELEKAVGGFQDIVITCKKCGNKFIYTAAQQLLHSEKGFANEPQLCDQCRAQRGKLDFFNGTCSLCGEKVVTIIKPSKGRAIYCDKCLQIMRREG